MKKVIKTGYYNIKGFLGKKKKSSVTFCPVEVGASGKIPASVTLCES